MDSYQPNKLKTNLVTTRAIPTHNGALNIKTRNIDNRIDSKVDLAIFQVFLLFKTDLIDFLITSKDILHVIVFF